MMTKLARQTIAYPALEEMGIQRAHEISHYSLRMIGEDKDVLKIHYKRSPGSFLPETRKYTFGRSLKTVIADGGTARMEHVYEISPFLLRAVAELDSLVGLRQTKPSQSRVSEQKREILIAELDELETLVAQSVNKRDASTIAARFSRYRAQLSAL